jgi:xylan 1,4-beta-xylosidase
MYTMMNKIFNPILKGFNPDPSILRVGDDFYIATSTFEWFPGVQIHHSKDLVNWQLIAHPLTKASQLDLRGVPDSCGVWAPCLSYENGTFYLVYSNVKSFAGVWKDTPNYLVTTNDIRGEWSEPIFLGASGFDGSLFHDTNGKKYFLSMLVDHRQGLFFGGIIIQEYCHITKKLVGIVNHITMGSDLGLTEGPHLYQNDGYYYLLLAEGGTEYGHAMTIARSKNIFGPYEMSPQNPLISSRNEPDHYLQKAGHGSLTQTQNGQWIAVFLVGRPITTHGRCILGRETAIETVDWPTNDWPRLSSGTCVPRVEVPVSNLPSFPFQKLPENDDFDSESLNICFQSLRVPFSASWLSLSERKGYLCLRGRESLNSFNEQSMVVRRIQSYNFTATTTIDFNPTSFQHLAGLVCYYNTTHFHYLHISVDDSGRRCIQVTSNNLFDTFEALENPIVLPKEGQIKLKVDMYGADLQFSFAIEDGNWIKVGDVLDASILSDDNVRDGGPRYMPAFTGAFVGMCCQDFSGNKTPAYFDDFSYAEGEYEFENSIKKELSWVAENI